MAPDVAGFTRTLLLVEKALRPHLRKPGFDRGELLDERVLGRKLDAGCTVDRVDARREDGDFIAGGF